MISIEDLKTEYEKLDGKYEGYIQMSSGRIEHIFKTPTKLPSWEDIHKNSKFIYEMVLYDVDKKLSILIRQVDNYWVCSTKEVDWDSADESDREVYYSLSKKREIKAVQVWKEENEAISEDFKVLIPIGVFFAGFLKEGDKI